MKTIVWTIQAVCLLGLVGLSGCASPMPASYSLHSARHKSGPSNDSSLTQATSRAGADHCQAEVPD